jgi:hypothetical protein
MENRALIIGGRVLKNLKSKKLYRTIQNNPKKVNVKNDDNRNIAAHLPRSG